MAGTGRVALVTGGTRGIGRAVSERLAASGVLVAAAYARDAAAASTLQERCAESGGEVSLHQADLSDPGVCGRLVSEVLARHGRLDYLVSNAGAGDRAALRRCHRRRLGPAAGGEPVSALLPGPGGARADDRERVRAGSLTSARSAP